MFVCKCEGVLKAEECKCHRKHERVGDGLREAQADTHFTLNAITRKQLLMAFALWKRDGEVSGALK